MSNQEQKIKLISRINLAIGVIITLLLIFFMNSSVFAQVIPNQKAILGGIAGIKSTPSEKDFPLLYRVYESNTKPHIKTIKFDVPLSSQVKLFIEDKFGNVVKAFLYDNLQTGSYEINLIWANLDEGNYVCKFSAGDYKKTLNLISER